jgi:HEAT repeat protein
MLDKALEALKTYDWGQDPKVLSPIDDAIVASHGDAAKRKDLEEKLSAALKGEGTRDGKQATCRYLMAIGSAACVPTLAALLGDKDLAHMGRFALERMPAPEAGAALRDALPKLSGNLKIGVIASLGARDDEASVAALAPLLADGDAATAQAAAKALGAIRSAEAAKALNEAKTNDAAKNAATDARLACAEALLAAGKKADALGIYKSLNGDGQPEHVKIAAKAGMLASVKM